MAAEQKDYSKKPLKKLIYEGEENNGSHFVAYGSISADMAKDVEETVRNTVAQICETATKLVTVFANAQKEKSIEELKLQLAHDAEKEDLRKAHEEALQRVEALAAKLDDARRQKSKGT